MLRELCRAAAETSKRVEGYYVGKTDMADYYEALAINLKYAEPEADIAGQLKWLEDSWGDEIAEQEEAEKTHERVISGVAQKIPFEANIWAGRNSAQIFEDEGAGAYLGVMDDNYLVRAQQTLGVDEGADGGVGDSPACVPYHVRFPHLR